MKWYGRRYPSMDDLETSAWDLGAVVVYGKTPSAFCYMDPEGPIIGIPSDAGPLEQAWLLAHELGHLVQHTGPRGKHLHGKDERQADRWAARAMIPESAVRQHRNASVDAFVAALSRHYQDIPFSDCPERRLAGMVAKIRLESIEEDVA